MTRSGTNALHGSVFETHRNNAAGLRARQIQDGATSPKYIRNEFGASAGGPIISDKTFWFGAYEGFRLRQARFVQSIVPTDAIWAGDFSSLIDSSGNAYRIFDPLTTDANGVRQQFPEQSHSGRPDSSLLQKAANPFSHSQPIVPIPFLGTTS